MNTNQSLAVTVVSPYEVLFSGQAQSVSSKNSAGPFDILPQHSKFITIIENEPITIRTATKNPIIFSFPLAILYVAEDKLRVYAQLALPKI